MWVVCQHVPFQLVLCRWWNKTIVTKGNSCFCLKMQLSLQFSFTDCFEIVVGHFLTNSCRTVANAINQKFRWLMLLVHVLKVCQRKWPVSNWTKRQRAWTLKDIGVWQAFHEDHDAEGSVLAQHMAYPCCPLEYEMITIIRVNKKEKTCCEEGEETWEGEVLTDACCKSIGCRFLKYKPNWWRDKKGQFYCFSFLPFFPWWECRFSKT